MKRGPDASSRPWSDVWSGAGADAAKTMQKALLELETMAIDKVAEWDDDAGLTTDFLITDYEKQLDAAIENGGVDPHSALGQKHFYRSSVAGYKECKGNAAKAKFRLDWCKMEKKKFVKQRQEQREHEDEDVASGSWESFDKIVEFEGGANNPDNIAAAKHYCSQCIALGGKWAKYDKWRKRTYFLYLKMGVRQTWRKKFTLTCTRGGGNEPDVETKGDDPIDNGDGEEGASNDDKDDAPPRKKGKREKGGDKPNKSNEPKARGGTHTNPLGPTTHRYIPSVAPNV